MEAEAVQALLSIGIVGTLLSMAIQALQDRFGVEGTTTKALAIVGSVVLGGFVWLFQGTEMWAAILGVLSTASTVYAMVFAGKRTNEREA